ncbi:TolC family protein [Parvularcula sp. LCG005]|uniref:TolC family protein n=1 Tax=Parvularcula sp. LCG005 TaxID=3078805 RepID=UPI002941E40C|nr:TolC family protein [Parvularcula sp. LCG005]WOI52984.1 TolC family protein [Parvularcula sp. LCG005]
MKFATSGALCVLLALTGPAIASTGPCGGYSFSPSPKIETGEPLTLNAALERVRTLSPEARAAALETQARVAEADQAGRWNNPTLLVEVENFGGSGSLSGFDQREATYAVEQVFEMGGQRSKRKAAARALAALASADCAVILREAELQTATLFYDLAAAAALTELAEDASALSEDLAAVVRRRVEAGAAAPPEYSRAASDAAAMKARAESFRANVDRLAFALSAMWGSDEHTFSPPILSTEQDADQVAAMSPHPLVARAEAAQAASLATARAERAEVFPDVSITLGVRQFEGTGEDALIAGIGVPLPLFDRNRDASRAADYRAGAADIDRDAALRRIAGEQSSVLRQVEALQRQVELLQANALPSSEEAYSASLRGYQAGRFSLTDTLDARRSLIETRSALIEAKRDLAVSQVRLASLLGTGPFSNGGRDAE